MSDRVFVGIDVGSASVNVVGVDASGQVVGSPVYLRIAEFHDAVDAVKSAFRLFLDRQDTVDVGAIGTTGSGRELNKHIVGGDLTRTEIFAHAVGITHLAAHGQVWSRGRGGEPPRAVSRVGSVIEIGGQDSKVIIFDDEGIPVFFNMNSICSAGTGEFLQQIADDAGISIAEFGPIALQATMPARIDSTCTVFSKRDFRHLTQKGVPLSDRLAGIASAMVNNYMTNVVGPNHLRSPVIFQGGVAGNQGVHAAFERRLGCEVVIPRFHDVMGAYGMALVVRDLALDLASFATKFKDDFFERGFESRIRYCHGCQNACEITQPLELGGDAPTVLDNLGGRCERSQNPKNLKEAPQNLGEVNIPVIRLASSSPKTRVFDIVDPGASRKRESSGICFAGIDGGSRGTKYAVITSTGKGIDVLAVGTLDTGGDAIKAIVSAVRHIRESLPKGSKLGGIGTTGSAGELARDIMATRTENTSDFRSTEILAHYAWASWIRPDVRTVIDIGGNDSKIICAKPNGLDFGMNDKCAAGTGSFIEAVAKRFEVPLERFGEEALRARQPARVAGRCAVFGESDLVHKSRLGFPVPDLLMGLCYAICRTYLSDVGKGKKLRVPIVAQGGSFLNTALQAAFRSVLGLPASEFVVDGDPRFVVGAGALGAALLARAKYEQGLEPCFKGFDNVLGSNYATVSLTCRDLRCQRSCQGLVALLENGIPIAGYKSIDCEWGMFEGMLDKDERHRVRRLLEAV
ncbi:MAG: hypothetical protein HYY08_03060 [Firmicutes bacterium]|nr:hypothetical protein [Bacillota bacterium]